MEHTRYEDTSSFPEQDPLYIQTTVAIGKTLLKGLPCMDKTKMKLLFVMLEHINWREPADSSIIVIDNQLAKKRLRWNIKEDATVASRIRNGFKSMVTECMITFQTDEDTKDDIPLILDVYGNKNYTAVAVNPVFMDQISDLPAYGEQYFQFNIEDIMGFHSQYSIYLYLELRQRQKYKKQYKRQYKLYTPYPMKAIFATKPLKDIMGLDRKKYVSNKIEKGTNDKKEHFNRSKFEKDVLARPLEEISHSHMIELFPPLEKDGECNRTKWGYTEWYLKKKRNGRVRYYHIRFCVREGLSDTVYGRYVNDARFNEISQGFAAESGKQKYQVWLKDIEQTMQILF